MIIARAFLNQTKSAPVLSPAQPPDAGIALGRLAEGEGGTRMIGKCSRKAWIALALTTPFVLAACGGGGSEALPEITATTTTTVQNQKAQPAHDSQIRQLDGSLLYALFSGREINGLTPEGRRWSAVFDPSGTANISWRGPLGGGRDTGSWAIEDNTNCVTWQTLGNGEENCMTVYKVDKGQYNLFNDNGSMNSLLSVPEL